MDDASTALAEVRDRDLYHRFAAALTRVRKLLAVQRETRSLQHRSLEVQLRSLEIQRRTLGHVRSLDKKTLGESPPLP